jgi:membrane protein
LIVHNVGAMSEHESAAGDAPAPVTGRKRPPRFYRSVVAQAFRKIRQDRVLGLAAEAGFWGIVSLPSLALSVFGSLGYLRGVLGDATVNHVRADVLRAARDVLTPTTVSTDVAPLLDQILARGHPAVISIAFVVSLWSGSTCMADYVNTITVAYEQRGVRVWYRTRARSLVLYLGAVVSGVIILPALTLGPNLISNLFPNSIRNSISLAVQIAYVPVVGLGSIAVVAGLYHLALPKRVPWRRGLPGATLAVALWLSGSFGVRTYLTSSFHNKSVYGSLSAPIAALIFFYVTALAVLIGAEVNSAIEVVHARPAVARGRRGMIFGRRLAARRGRRRLQRAGIAPTAATPTATEGGRRGPGGDDTTVAPGAAAAGSRAFEGAPPPGEGPWPAGPTDPTDPTHARPMGSWAAHVPEGPSVGWPAADLAGEWRKHRDDPSAPRGGPTNGLAPNGALPVNGAPPVNGAVPVNGATRRPEAGATTDGGTSRGLPAGRRGDGGRVA